jgi:hypothetical protein
MTVPICCVSYEYHNDSSPNAIMTALKAALPSILIDNTSYSLWGTNGGYGGASNCVASEYTPLGIKVFSYITSGYCGTSYGDTRDSLADNLTRIAGMKATDLVTGVFLDEVPNYPTTANKTYIQSIYDTCINLGLQLIVNTGLSGFDTWLLSRCHFIMTDEAYNGTRLPTTSENVALSKVLVVSVNLSTAVTAAARTNAAFAKGFYYHYSCNLYTTLPTWLGDYVALLTYGAPPDGGGGEVTGTADDGYSDGTTLSNSQTWFLAGSDSGVSYDAFFRFSGLAIPYNATITAAVMRYAATQWDTGTNLRVYLEDAGTASQIAAATSHAARTRTTNYAAWTTGYGDNAYHYTPDFTSAVQELVTSYGAIDTIQVLVDDNGSAANAACAGNTFDNSYPPTIEITYTTVSGWANIAKVASVTDPKINRIAGIYANKIEKIASRSV